jgi:hypothetical protein
MTITEQLHQQVTEVDDEMATDLCRAGFELKFIVPEAKAADLLQVLCDLLSPDPFAGPDGEYDVMSLYLDTPDLLSYRREVGYKWRIRRYGASSTLFAEVKGTPEKGKTVKRRTEFDADDLAKIVHRDGPAKWFSKQIDRNDLTTTRLVTYRRNAFVGDLGDESMRVTLDRNLRADYAAGLFMPAKLASGVSLGTHRVLEVKFANTMPAELRAPLEFLGLAPESFSKYRQAIERL